MLSFCRSVVLTALALAPLLCTGAQAQSFEQLIEETLRRQRLQAGEGTEETAPPLVLAPSTPTTGEPTTSTPGATTTPPGTPPPPPNFNPVELGPRPYTPPSGGTVPPPAETAATGGAAGGGASGGTAGTTTEGGTTAGGETAATGGTTAPGATTPGATDTQVVPPVPPGTERTRESLQVAEVNAATFGDEALAVGGANPLILKAQVLLDRVGASPGAIDAYAGGNLSRAVAAVETVLRLEVDGKLDAQIWEVLHGDATQDVLVQYTITETDLAYPFVAAIPDELSQQALLPSLGYASPQEMLAERFHMDVKLLAALNPDADFSAAGTVVWVTSVEGAPLGSRLASVLVDKTARQVRGYDAQNRLIVAYPASIGSAATPAPAGEFRVESVSPNPVFAVDPGALASAGAVGPLTLPPGPNNPVGTTWISLSGTSCGIHGSASPTTVGKDAEQGCVRLTNWDAEELANLIEPGVVVAFAE